jgi:hypothetical protein
VKGSPPAAPFLRPSSATTLRDSEIQEKLEGMGGKLVTCCAVRAPAARVDVGGFFV